MAQLRQDFAQFTARDTEILVVCPEKLVDVRRYWERERLPFLGLADPDHTVAGAYEQEVSLFKLGRMPTLTIIDRRGAIRYEHHATWMNDIPENKTLLDVLDALNVEWAGRR